ncbi:uncharacterized protein HD556DRAFT_1314583 [Suillus plorans]|uniref:Uncharacterized protein n=1 Tax=Suillus plorans TaxID=116603 RepID=A0A9P7AAD8_9AGAM|nr:uncharacterized protein HD556DRAFT_1314583 [Suillus plorans]KAG1785038.1 hypothetical protein HD556DRAFT_1314583 [Suillus plorans]
MLLALAYHRHLAETGSWAPEPDAVYLFVELDINVVDRIARLVDANAFGRSRVCAMLLPSPDDITVTFSGTIDKIYLQFSKFPEALDFNVSYHPNADSVAVSHDRELSALKVSQ